MLGKTPVSVLQEYCAKKGLTNPIYEIAESSEDGAKIFICMVEAVDELAEGSGRSKKEAKHDAAKKLLEKLKFIHSDIEKIPQIEQKIPSVNNAIESTEKDTEQLAAKKLTRMMQLISIDSDENNVASSSQVTKEQETKICRKIQTNRELIGNDEETSLELDVSLCDRRNHFKRINGELKAKAFQVLNNNNYLNYKEQVDDLLKTLNIDYKINEILIKSGTKTFTEITCGLDVVFIAKHDVIYEAILEYFRNMLD